MQIPAAFYFGFSTLGMGLLAYYAGSLDQSEWDELVFYEYDRQPWRRSMAKYMGAAFILIGVAIFAWPVIS